jgi:hypothetical protein
MSSSFVNGRINGSGSGVFSCRRIRISELLRDWLHGRLALPLTANAARALPPVFGLRRLDGLPLQIRNCVGSTAGERNNVIFYVSGASACRLPGRRAGMLPLEFVLDLQ